MSIADPTLEAPAASTAFAREAAAGPHWDLVCLSHLRWDFVWQRPQHLMSRFTRGRRVLFVEEPAWDVPAGGEPRLELAQHRCGVTVAVPHLPEGAADAERIQERLLADLLGGRGIERYVLWYYTPMALGVSRGLEPLAVVYDCMDELSLFRGAPPELLEREAELLARADLVFTGGQSLWEAKRDRHPSVHAFPSSIDAAHFAGARAPVPEPEDQARLSRPRLGYFGVIDERMDLPLVEALAAARPDWQIVMLGPVVKVDPETLPRRDNIHWLGMKSYEELPAYLAGWDVALMPFARNESTRFISPTKTPEYLAGGRPVVSTSIRDVVRPYGEVGLVEIADDAESFVAAAERALHVRENGYPGWLERVDGFLTGNSWDETFTRMEALIDRALRGRPTPGAP